MFTGLVEDLGTVRRLRRGADGMQLTVTTAIPLNEIHLGDSIAVNGACLTVTACGRGCFEADVSPETLNRTGLGRLDVGCKVNLERALQMGGRLGGHLVSGHVDTLATVVSRCPMGNAVAFSFALPSEQLRYVVEKGSIAIDGISLTVNEVRADGFSVAVIPHTLGKTTLGLLGAGDRVNIETDLIGKYIERLLPQDRTAADSKGRIDTEYLAKNGFL